MLSEVNEDLFGRRGEGALSLSDLGISPANEVKLTHSIVQRCLSTALMHTFDDSNKHCLAIQRVFPLHDNNFNKYLLRTARKAPIFFALGGPGTRTSQAVSDVLDDIKDHFGQSVALYFAFVAFYTRSIVWLAAGWWHT